MHCKSTFRAETTEWREHARKTNMSHNCSHCLKPRTFLRVLNIVVLSVWAGSDHINDPPMTTWEETARKQQKTTY